MSYEKVENFYNELGELLKIVSGARQQVSTLTGQQFMARKLNDNDNAIKITNALEATVERVAEMQAVLNEYTTRSDFEGAKMLYTDVAARMRNADKFFDAWRSMEASYELGAVLGEFTEEERAEATEKVNQCKERYERQVELASNLIPVRSSIIELVN